MVGFRFQKLDATKLLRSLRNATRVEKEAGNGSTAQQENHALASPIIEITEKSLRLRILKCKILRFSAIFAKHCHKNCGRISAFFGVRNKIAVSPYFQTRSVHASYKIPYPRRLFHSCNFFLFVCAFLPSFPRM